jgi:hypothetical protein
MIRLSFYGLGVDQQETPPLSIRYHVNGIRQLTMGVCRSFMIPTLSRHMTILYIRTQKTFSVRILCPEKQGPA